MDKRDVSRCILVLDTSLFVHFDDEYFWTEGVLPKSGFIMTEIVTVGFIHESPTSLNLHHSSIKENLIRMDVERGSGTYNDTESEGGRQQLEPTVSHDLQANNNRCADQFNITFCESPGCG